MLVPQHLDGLRTALVEFVRYVDRAGLAAPVPTAPDWTVRQLVAHQGMVHRWAVAVVRGESIDPDSVESAGLLAADPVEWLRDGAVEVAQAISDVAGPARQLWARRQCHETTIHAVDALAAALGRGPRAADTWISTELAVDGIDELLTGSITWKRSRLRCEEPMTIAVRPADSQRSWLVRVGPDSATTERDPGLGGHRADVVLEGSAVALYLTLWNRSDEVSPVRDWDLWAEGGQVRTAWPP